MDKSPSASHTKNLTPPLKALHVYRTYFPDPPGGTQEAIRQLCLAVNPYGISTEVFALSPRPYPPRLEVPEAVIHRQRSWLAPASCDIGGFAAFSMFADLAATADIVHFHHPWPFADLLNLTMRTKKPSVLSYHSDIVRQVGLERLYSPLRHLHFRRVKAIVATSPNYLRTSRLLAAPQWRDKVLAIPLGLADRPALSPPLPSPCSEPYFLFVGALRYYKGLSYLIDAAAQVRHTVVVCGEGPQTEELQAHARRVGASNVRFLGLVDEETKHRLMASALALILPSHLRSEAFGMVLTEAAMHSRPMITCEIGTGTSFVNVNGETGLVVPPADPDALALAMDRLAGEPAIRERFGHAARARYLRLFSSEALGNSFARLYQNVLNGRPPSEGLPAH